MKVPLLSFNIFWFSLAVLCLSVNSTPAVPSRGQREFQKDLNNFEIAIQNLLGYRSSTEQGGSPRAGVVDASFGSKNRDKQVRKDRTFKERLTGSKPDEPVAIDLAYQPQKQRLGNQEGHHKFVAELDEGKQEEQENTLGSESSQLDTSGDDDDDEDEEEQAKYSTETKIKNNPVKDDGEKIKNLNKKGDFEVSFHEPKKKNSTLKDLFIPQAIDLAFQRPNGPTKKSPTARATTTKPTTLYWPPTTTSNPTPNQICRSKIDLGFLVEASKSVARTGPGNYRRLMNFVKHIVLKFAIGPSATRIGVISYANRPIALMGFEDGENIQDVLKFLNLPCHHCWNAQTGLALSFAHSYLYGCSCNLRQKVLVVVTDGSSSDGVHIPSRILKENGVKIIAIGIGRYFNIHQLNIIASRPVQNNVFTGDLSRIHHATNDIVIQICKVAEGSMVPTSSSPCKCP